LPHSPNRIRGEIIFPHQGNFFLSRARRIRSSELGNESIALAHRLLSPSVEFESVFALGSTRPSDISEEVIMNDTENAKARGRGFASMDSEKQRSIASLGGRAAHQHGTAHEFSSEEAREAGRKGGEAVSANRAHMAAIGRKGGEASHRGSAKRAAAEAPSSTSSTSIVSRGPAVDSSVAAL
jgi:uncharacterized protein